MKINTRDMTFTKIGSHKVVNLDSVASATMSDKGEQGVKLTVLFTSGINDVFTGNDARKLWTAMQEAAKGIESA
jgi:hypothetical protein